MPTQRDVQRLMALREAERRGAMGSPQSAALREIERRFQKFAEPAATMVSAAIAEPVSGLVGLAALPFGSDVATNAISRTQQAMTYSPRSQAGKDGLQAAQDFMAPVGQAFEGASSYLGDAAYEATGSPAAGAAAYSVPAMGMEMLGLKGTRAASNAGKLGKQLEMGDIGRGNVGANQRGIFAGVKAKTADMDALNKAQEMMAQGANRDEVWNETGWFKDVDGGWKFEIDDSASALEGLNYERMTQQAIADGDYDLAKQLSKEGRDYTMPYQQAGAQPLSDVLRNDNLYSAYPDARSIRFQGDERLPPGNASYSPKRDSMFLGEGTGQGPARQSMLHELQHGIQTREGFAEGGGVTEIARNLAQRKSRAESRIGAVNAEMRRVAKEMEGNPANMDELNAQYDALLDERMQYLKDAQLDPEIQAFDEYQRLAGEAEARNVETRMNMSAAERRATPPWKTIDVPEDELIIRRKGVLAEGK